MSESIFTKLHRKALKEYNNAIGRISSQIKDHDEANLLKDLWIKMGSGRKATVSNMTGKTYFVTCQLGKKDHMSKSIHLFLEQAIENGWADESVFDLHAFDGTYNNNTRPHNSIYIMFDPEPSEHCMVIKKKIPISTPVYQSKFETEKIIVCQ